MKRKGERSGKSIIVIILFITFLFTTVPYNTKNSIKVPNVGGVYVPEGIIALWSGSLDSIPEGWVLCDGTEGTPDTTNLFVRNTNGTEDPGTLGGYPSHFHPFSEVPLHDHGQTGYNACRHSHTYNLDTSVIEEDVALGPSAANVISVDQYFSGTGFTDYSQGLHSHMTTTSGVDNGNTTTLQNVNPPYLRLAYIKKISNDPTIPEGVILVWTGLVENVPEGWTVCNGSNSTPNLGGKFVMGENLSDPGSIGGNLTHFHQYSEIPSHNHSTSTNGASHRHTATYHAPLNPLPIGSFFMFWQNQTSTESVLHSHHMNAVGKEENCLTEETDHQPPYTTVAFIMNTEECSGIPTGCVAMWDETINNIPYGWSQCDGNLDTIDLRGNFLKGFSESESIGMLGGSLTHSHAYTEIPYHNHSVQISDLRHNHLYSTYYPYSHEQYDILPGFDQIYLSTDGTQETGESDANHAHTILPTGVEFPETEPVSNLPPYIELTFIQQLSPLTAIDWVSPDEYTVFTLPGSPTVRFDFEYSWIGMGSDITLSFCNGSQSHDAGIVTGLDWVIIPYLDGSVDATLHLMQGPIEITNVSRSFTFKYNQAPTVTLLNPNGGEIISGSFEVNWTGSDPDGDQLHYNLEFNIDDTGWGVLVADLTGTSYIWDTTSFSDSDSVKFRVVAVDAFGVQAIDECDAPFEIRNKTVPGYNLVILFSMIAIVSGLLIWKKKCR